MKRSLCDLQELCLVTMQKALESVVSAILLAVELVDDAVVAWPGAVDVIDLRIDKLAGSLASCKEEGI